MNCKNQPHEDDPEERDECGAEEGEADHPPRVGEVAEDALTPVAQLQFVILHR